MSIEQEKLFNQIINVHYSTDYSSIDRIYPPFFVWDENNKNQVERYFKRLKNKCSEFDLYIHFPYCEEKCAFCRHCSWVPQAEIRYDEYLNYLEKEIKKYGEFFSRPQIGHIYFGGGTPTLFRLGKVMRVLRKHFRLLPDFQFNIESTFSSLNEEKLKKLKVLGIKRLVLGVQSFDEQVLKKINRTQTKEYFEKIYKIARRLNIETINVELMGGLPGQTYESFMEDLKYLIDLGVDSVHIYSYMQTPQTPLGKVGENKVDNDLKIKMIRDGEKLLEEKGFVYYGDDYSRKREDRNLSISRINRLGVGKLSLGVSAVGFIPTQNWQMLAYLNTTNLEDYFKSLDSNNFPVDKFYFLKRDETFRSLLINNLRMLDTAGTDERLVKYLKKKFKKELEIIKDKCEVIDDGDRLVVKDWLFNSKYLYSNKILKKCQKKIDKDFPNTSGEIGI